jgi:hypothetical protein
MYGVPKMKTPTAPQLKSKSNQDSTHNKCEPENYKTISTQHERQLFQKVFQPKIKRKPYKKRSVRRTCEKLVNSFYPETEVSYDALKYRLMTKFGRCSRQTILSYLGRPATRQKETVDHLVTYSKSGTITNKSHTFIHKLPRKKGYIEIFSYASLLEKGNKCYFRLFHTRQTDLKEEISPPQTPPNESIALKECSCEVSDEFKEALAYAKRQVSDKSTSKNFLSVNSDLACVIKKPVLQANGRSVVEDGEEREYIKREKKFEISESNLTDEEAFLFSLYDSSCKEAS